MKTFGCQMNENDSAFISSLLQNAGHSKAISTEEADIIVVNTCCVRQNAENKAFGYIGSLKRLKEKNADVVIAVCGCMVQKDGNTEAFLKKARHVGILCGTFAISRLPEYIEEYRGRGEVIVDIQQNYEQPGARQIFPHIDGKSYKAQVNIIYGCDNFCAYCIVPYVRGRERSRAPQQIIEEVQLLVRAGVKEVQLLGQNVNSFGKDFADNSCDFARLLQILDEIEGLRRIRYMTSHPRDFSTELVDVVVNSRHICHHFHLPLQAGCDKILLAMNRGYNTAYYGRLLEKIRQKTPNATITSDLIVGFPGETEQDFRQTLDFVAACQFDAAYTFLYSERSGTPAAQMPDQVNAEVKKERLHRLMSIQNPISLRHNQKLIGQTQNILVEGPSKNKSDHWYGRNDGNKIVVFPYIDNSGIEAGRFITVQILQAQTWNLYGEAIFDN